MEKRVILAFLTCTILLIAGCSGGGSGQTTSGKSFVGGTDGIDITFMDNAPPSEVFDTTDSEFEVSVRIQNKGEDDVTASQGFIKVVGVDGRDFGNPVTQKAIPDVFGVRLDPQGNMIPGTIVNVDFPGWKWSGEQLAGNIMLNMRADLCFEYQGKSVSNLCLKKNLLQPPKASDVCPVSRSVTPENSGSPIAISEFSQSPVGQNKLSFSFKVKHVGTGRIFDPSLSGDLRCDDTKFANQDKVEVIVESTGLGGTVTCSTLQGNNNIVKLFNNEAIVSCTLDGVTGDYEKALTIKTRYNYLRSVPKPLLVRHIARDATETA